MEPKPIGMNADQYSSATNPWQSWGSATRYLIVYLAQAIPYAVLTWQA